jgi:hypothetical protein
MLNELKSYYKNRRAKKGRPPCEATLGDTHKLGQFSQFWADNGEDLMIVAAAKLHEYTSEKSFDEHELKAFKEGLACIGTFFADCAVEIEKLKELENQQSSKGVSGG